MKKKMKIKFIIDSASDIEIDEADKLDIDLIPMEVRFSDEETYLDGINLSHKAFFEKLIECDDLPTTSQINPYNFEEKFAKYTKEGYEVIAITLTSKLSGTYQNALIAASNFENKVYVVDSLNACVGERLLLLHGLELAKNGMDAKSIAAELDRVKHNIRLLALLDTLEYLKKGGRISSTAAMAGTLFSIKPVIGIIDGEVKVIGKAMGSRKGNNLLRTLTEKCEIDFSMPYGVVYSGLDDTVLNKYIKDSESIWKDKVTTIPSYLIGSTIGTHIGPGGIGVAFFEKEKK